MTDDMPPTDLVPLLFTTALVVYVLAMGSVDLARTSIRVVAAVVAAACLGIWTAAVLNQASWGGPVIEEFYATALLTRSLGEPGGALVLAALALFLLGLALRDFRQFRLARLGDR